MTNSDIFEVLGYHRVPNTFICHAEQRNIYRPIMCRIGWFNCDDIHVNRTLNKEMITMSRPPSMPIALRGTIKYTDGKDVEKGAEIYAYIDGTVVNNHYRSHITPADGRYGVMPPISWDNLNIVGSPEYNGADVVFTVNGVVIEEMFHITNWDDMAWEGTHTFAMTVDRIGNMLKMIEDVQDDIVGLAERIETLE